MRRHEKTCTQNRKLKYHTGVYEPQKPLHLRAKELGFDFPEGYQTYPYVITWDIESSLKKTDYIPATKKRKVENEERSTFYTAEHSVLSVASSTDFRHPELDPTLCFVREGDDQVHEIGIIDKVVSHWENIQNFAQQELLQVFDPVLEQINAKIAEEEEFEADFLPTVAFSDDEEEGEAFFDRDSSENEEEEGFFDEGADEQDEEGPEETSRVTLDQSPLQKLKEDLLDWISQIPVIAFNGCNYDINVIKEFLLPRLAREYGIENINVLKKQSNYLCISTPRFRFIDMKNFLPPTFNLDTFIKSFKAEQQKGVFPYEAVQSVADLERTYCPRIEEFHSEFRNSDITLEEWETKVHRVWNENGMRTWKDFLVHYNLSDVVPFLTAVKNYEAKFEGADLWKTFVSLSSASYNIGFKKTPETDKFFKCPENIYKLMKDNVVGGFTSATTRYFKKDETKIRGGKITGGIHGFDCNAMYLGATGGTMPTGLPTLFTWNGRVLKEQRPYGASLISREWLDSLKNQYPDLQTAFNVGMCFFRFFFQFSSFFQHLKFSFSFSGEKRIGNRRYRADGYSPSANKVFQFDGKFVFNFNLLKNMHYKYLKKYKMCLGCYYHGCKDCEKENFSCAKKKSWADSQKKNRS